MTAKDFEDQGVPAPVAPAAAEAAAAGIAVPIILELVKLFATNLPAIISLLQALVKHHRTKV